MKKVYLAARYRRREELSGYAEELRGMGYSVDCHWLKGDHTSADNQLTDGALAMAEAQRFVIDDWGDVLASDIVISFTEKPRQGDSRGGRHVELGIALGLEKQCLVVGFRENVFHYLPQVAFCETWEDAKALLEINAHGGEGHVVRSLEGAMEVTG